MRLYHGCKHDKWNWIVTNPDADNVTGISSAICGNSIITNQTATAHWTPTSWKFEDIKYETTGAVQYYTALFSQQTVTVTGCSLVNTIANWTKIDETPEEKEARLVKEAAEKIEAEAAEKKAEALLMMILTDVQKEQYLKDGYFETEVNDRVYRLKKGWSGNVEQIINGKASYRYCIHPGEFVPIGDNLIAQLLLLRNNEKEFLEKANRTTLY